MAEANYFKSTKGAAVERLSAVGRQVLAANILERYGTEADVNSDGVVDDDEKEAVMQLLRIHPHLDGAASPAAKLALAYNFFHGVSLAIVAASSCCG